MDHSGIHDYGKKFCTLFRLFTDINTNGKLSRLYISSETDLSIINYLQGRNSFYDLPIRVSPEEIESLIAKKFSKDEHTAKQSTDSSVATSDQRIVSRISNIIEGSIHDSASDIHFEATEHHLQCRVRIDGILNQRDSFHIADMPEMLSRIKIIAGLDIAEKRRPQDGRIRFPIDGRAVDIRVSIIPTDFGEKAVLRILDKSQLKLDLNNLGFKTDQLALFKESIARPNGIILVTGPTGSGKTTTLYAALHHLKSSSMNISSVEDPIEYNLEGVNQTQVKPEINLTFSAMLRSLLRQDPNIIMVGEIRDRETLDISIRTSLTGHLVLSTIHTNSAVATTSRLLDMGAEPYLLASTLVLIVAQRLVRKVCPKCSSSEIPDNEQFAAKSLGLDLSSGVRVGKGCQHCRETGYKGRTSVYELFPIFEDLKSLIHDRAPEADILDVAQSHGVRTMKEMAFELVLSGTTTPTEVLRELHA